MGLKSMHAEKQSEQPQQSVQDNSLIEQQSQRIAELMKEQEQDSYLIEQQSQKIAELERHISQITQQSQKKDSQISEAISQAEEWKARADQEQTRAKDQERKLLEEQLNLKKTLQKKGLQASEAISQAEEWKNQAEKSEIQIQKLLSEKQELVSTVAEQGKRIAEQTEQIEKLNEAEKDNGYSHKDFLVLTNYQEEISSHLFDAVDWQYPDTLFDEWIDGNEINKIGNKYIFTAGMELNDFLKMEYLKDFQQGNVNILGVDGKKYISLEDLVNFDVDRYSEKCLNVVYENEKRESQMQEKIMQFHFNLEFVNKKYKNADVVLKVWATEICREQGLSDYYPVQDVKDAFKTMEYIDEKEAVEIVLNDSEETLIYHKSPEEEYFTREALKHETINFDKESEIEEDLDELEK